MRTKTNRNEYHTTDEDQKRLQEAVRRSKYDSVQAACDGVMKRWVSRQLAKPT